MCREFDWIDFFYSIKHFNIIRYIKLVIECHRDTKRLKSLCKEELIKREDKKFYKITIEDKERMDNFENYK